MKNELPVYFSFQISCVIIHLLTTKSLFAHGEHIFCVGEYVFTMGEYIFSVGEQNKIHLFFHKTKAHTGKELISLLFRAGIVNES